MAQAYISLGSNKDNRAENINRAVWAIAAQKEIKVQKVSGIYEATFHELPEKREAYFAAIRVETSLSPEELLEHLLGVEKSFGKERLGETVIDLDLLMFEGEERQAENLKLPHPEIKNRPHIICPLLNLYADKELKDILKNLGEDNVKYTGEGLYLPL